MEKLMLAAYGQLPGESALMADDLLDDAVPVTARLLLVDDHAIVREGLASLLEEESDLHVVGESGSAQAALEFMATAAVDLVVLDLRMPGMPAADAVRAMHRAQPYAKILILTSFLEDREVHAVLSAGAAGFMLKDAGRDEILCAIRRILAGDCWIDRSVQGRVLQLLRKGATQETVLTQRERQVLDLLGQGLSNKRIAQALGITEGTVKSYLRQLFPKIGATDRLQAALYARGLPRSDEGG